MAWNQFDVLDAGLGGIRRGHVKMTEQKQKSISIDCDMSQYGYWKNGFDRHGKQNWVLKEAHREYKTEEYENTHRPKIYRTTSKRIQNMMEIVEKEDSEETIARYRAFMNIMKKAYQKRN